jgi:1-deoxy-D-xylulose-5-phosphate synthase
MLAAALEAAEILAADGLKATVWDPRVVKPLNDELLADAAGHSLVVTIEDGFKEGGAGTAVREALATLSSEAKVVVLGVPVEYIAHGKPDDILARLGLDGAGIAATVRAESKGVIPPRAAAG